MKEPQWTKCFLFNGDRFLLVMQGDNKKWTLPGGGLKSEESSKEGVKREVKEELGVDLNNVEKIGEWETDSRGFSERIYYFKSQVEKDDVFIDDGEINRFKWFKLDQVPESIGLSVKKGLELLE